MNNEHQTPVKQCRVGIRFSTGKIGSRGGEAIEIIPTTFLYTTVAGLIERCDAAGVVLLQDPKELTDSSSS